MYTPVLLPEDAKALQFSDWYRSFRSQSSHHFHIGSAGKKLHLSKFETHLGTAPSRLQEFQSTCSCQLNNRAANPLVLSFELTPTGDSVRLRIRHGIVRISGNIPEEKQRKSVLTGICTTPGVRGVDDLCR